MSAEVIATKSVAAGGLAAAMTAMLGDTETVSLIAVGAFAAISSFIYDCAHKKIPECGLRQTTDAMKYVFYGVALMFVAFYIGLNEIGKYIDMPKTAWGFVAAIIAGSAVTIVEWITPKIGEIVSKILGRVK